MKGAKEMPVDEQLLQNIKCYAEDYYFQYGTSPSIRDIASRFNVGKSTVQRYIERLKNSGQIEYDGQTGIRTDIMNKANFDTSTVGLVGSVSCGPLNFAEENITEYFKLPTSLVGKGEFFMLKASGNSMINAGIDDGDLVLIRKQNTAEIGQIVVALVGDDTTLKRFYKDEKNKRFILHPENDELDDIIVEGDLIIQGVAIKVLKDLI
jgi:repressor LexA